MITETNISPQSKSLLCPILNFIVKILLQPKSSKKDYSIENMRFKNDMQIYVQINFSEEQKVSNVNLGFCTKKKRTQKNYFTMYFLILC